MSFNSLGQFIINSAGQPVVAGTTITSTAFNALTADLATGLSTTICKDGQTTTTAIIPFASGISLSGGTTLANYLESTWTPSVGGTATYTTQTGTYTRIGRFVFFRCNLTINAIGSGSTAVISGLPLSAAILTSVTIGYFTGLALSATFLGAYVTTNVITLTGLTAAAASVTDNFPALASGTRLEISGSYQI